jgi:hypothetical protein
LKLPRSSGSHHESRKFVISKERFKPHSLKNYPKFTQKSCWIYELKFKSFIFINHTLNFENWCMFWINVNIIKRERSINSIGVAIKCRHSTLKLSGGPKIHPLNLSSDSRSLKNWWWMGSLIPKERKTSFPLTLPEFIDFSVALFFITKTCSKNSLFGYWIQHHDLLSES